MSKLTTKTDSGSPYKLDDPQTLKASTALLKHISDPAKPTDTPQKQNLLAGDSSNPADAQPIWLVLTTKKHIVTQPRLKPGKVSLPHSLNISPDLSICLITPDPQRAFKNLVQDPIFPKTLSKKITRVIDIKKLEKKYYSFESKRKLRDSHDIFLADDRIITYLSKILGKTFYGNPSKRPIPVHLEAYKDKGLKKNAALPSTKAKKDTPDIRSITTPQSAGKEIESTLSTTQINLSPSTTTSVKVGLSSQKPAQVAENIKAVVTSLTEKYIPRQWRGVKAIHIKGPNTMALPIWLADELWDDESMVIEDEAAEKIKAAAIEKNKSKKRSLDGAKSVPRIEAGNPASGTKRKAGVEDEGFSEEMKARRQKLRQARDIPSSGSRKVSAKA